MALQLVCLSVMCEKETSILIIAVIKIMAFGLFELSSCSYSGSYVPNTAYEPQSGKFELWIIGLVHGQRVYLYVWLPTSR